MSLPTDERAVSTIIGVTLVFAAVVLAFSAYQAVFVPNENRQVEFEHYLDVQKDIKEVRRTLIEVGQTNNQLSANVYLGTGYPPRMFAINPPSVAGRLQTDTVGNGRISLTGVNTTAICGEEFTRTKALTYTPAYYYLDSSPAITYENTILYRKGEGGGILLDSDQALISGNSINIFPLLGNVSENSVGSVSLDFQGDVSGFVEVSKSVKLTIPTRLSATRWEDDLLSDEPKVKNVTANSSRESAVDAHLKASTYEIRCTPTGATHQPNVTITQTGEGDEINPGGPGAVALANEGRLGGGDDNIVEIHLNNSAEFDLQIREARINFYQDADIQGSAPTQANLTRTDGTIVANLEFRGTFKQLEPNIELTGNNTVTTVQLRFLDESDGKAGIDTSDWFVMSVRYSNGKSATYFVPVTKKGT